MNDDKRLERIEDKLDKITDKLTEHTAIHARNTASLEHHIARTDLLEDSLKPLKQTDTIIRFLVKAVLWAGGALALVTGIIKLLKGN